MDRVKRDNANDGLEIDLMRIVSGCPEQIANTRLPDGRRVSTVRLAFVHGHDAHGREWLYETMVFESEKAGKPRGYDLSCERYATREDAVEGHGRTVAAWTVWEA